VTSNQLLGLGVLFVIGSIVVGYIVFCLVPAKHYPRTAGVLAANACMGGLTAAGIEPAAYIVVWMAFASMYALMHTVDSDIRGRNSN
jgi:hypothetical protein